MGVSLKGLGLVALAVLTLVSFAPLLAVVLAGTLATTLGCELDEGSVHPCVLSGVDIGDALYTAFVLGWLTFLTWPGMLAALAIWTWLAVRRLWRICRPVRG